jgi:hypothetical protein
VIFNRLILAAFDDEEYADADKWSREGRRRFPLSPRLMRSQLTVMLMPDAAPDPRVASMLADSIELVTVGDANRQAEHLLASAIVAGVLARAGLKDSARVNLVNAQKELLRGGAAELTLVYRAYAWTLVGDHTEALGQFAELLAKYPNSSAAGSWMFRELSTDARYGALRGGRPPTVRPE